MGGSGPAAGGSANGGIGGAAGQAMGGFGGQAMGGSDGGSGGAAGLGAGGGTGGQVAATVLTDDDPADLAVDDTAIYWLNYGSVTPASVQKLSKSGGVPITLALSPLDPFRMALDDLYVYWLTYGPNSAEPQMGGLQRVLKSGGPVETLHKNADYPAGLAVAGTGIWWANSTISAGGAQIVRTDKLGGDMILASGENNPLSFAASGSRIYWVSRAPGVTLRSMDQGGGPVVSEAADQTEEGGLEVAAFGNSVFWTSTLGVLYSLRTDVPSQPVALDSSGTSLADGAVAAVAADAANVYWVADPPLGIHYRSLTDPTAVSKLLVADAHVWRIASDGAHVYWISVGTFPQPNTIFSLPVP